MRKNRNVKFIPRFMSCGAVLLALGTATALAAMSPAQQAVYSKYELEAKTADPAFTGFDAKRGETLFHAKHAGGKPDTPSCTTCHTTNLTNSGETRAGKRIEPMAASVNPKRFTDPAEVAKWFKRNCGDVLGRACTAKEKGDVLAYLLSL